MDILKPIIYDKFHCIGGECVLTCCGGWNIDIDEKTYFKYKEEMHALVMPHIEYDETLKLHKMRLNSRRLCPMCDKEQLCILVKEKGEEALSETCHVFPRNTIFTLYEEKYLSLGCPKVVDLLSELENPLSFILEEGFEEESVDELTHEEQEERQKVDEAIAYDMAIRDIMLELLQNRNFPLWFRQFLVAFTLDKIKEAHKRGDREQVNVELERILQPQYVEQLFHSLTAVPKDGKNQMVQLKQITLVFQDYILRRTMNDNYGTMEKISEILNQNLKCSFDEYKSAYEEWSVNQGEQFDVLMEHVICNNWMHYALMAYNDYYLWDNFMDIILEQVIIRHLTILQYSLYHEVEKEMQELIISLCMRAINHGRDVMKEQQKVLKEQGILSIANLYLLLQP